MENNVKFGTGEQDIKKVTIQASRSANNETLLQKVYIEYNNGTVIRKILPRLTQAGKREYLTKLLRKYGATNDDYKVAEYKDEMIEEFNRLADEAKKARKTKVNEGIVVPVPEYVINLNIANEEALEEENIEVPTEEIKKAFSTGKKVGFATTLAGLAVAVGIGGCTFFSNKTTEDLSKAQAKTRIETMTEDNSEIVDDLEKVSLEGKDYNFYKEEAIDNDQKSSIVGIGDFALNFNKSESWMSETITPEMRTVLEEAGIYLPADQNEAIFGYTADQLFAMQLKYSNLTNEQYATIMNGKQINVTDITDSSQSLANQGVWVSAVYYLNGEQAHLNLPFEETWSQEDKDAKARFEDKFFEYKTLLHEEKYDEAEKCMQELKEELVEYARHQDVGVTYAKPYILSTIGVASTIYSRMYNYKADTTIYLYDTETNSTVEKTINTDLWDEITNRDLFEGYVGCESLEPFDAIEFLKKFDVDSNRYTITISDNGVSVINKYTDSFINKLESYNEYASNEREDTLAELTKYSYDSQTLLELINNELKVQNKYPSDIRYFTSMFSKFVQEVFNSLDIMFKDGELIANGGKSQTIKTIPGRTIYVPGTSYTVTFTETWTETSVSYRTERKANPNYAEERAAAEAAAIKAASATTVIDGATGQEKGTTYQDIYNNAVNQYTNGGTGLSTNLDSDDKTNKNDPLVNKVESWAKEDSEKINSDLNEIGASTVGEHVITGGETTTTTEYSQVITDNGGNTATEVTNNEGQQLDVASEDEAAAYNAWLNSQQNQQQESTPAPQEGYTSVDPTSSPTFAPVIDEIVNSMSSAAAPEESDGMSR